MRTTWAVSGALGLGVAVGAALLVGILRHEPAGALSPRLVLLYATCTLQREFLSPYAPSVAFTPELDRFAREGVVFERHRTEASMSGIAFASIFSGRQAAGHGVFTHPRPLPPDVYDVTEAFADGGFETHYWAAHSMASPDLDYGQGVPADHARPRRLRGSDPEFQALLKRLRDDPEARALVVTAFTVTHGAYGADRVNTFCTVHPQACAVREELGDERVRELASLYRRSDREESLRYGFPDVVKRHGLSEADVGELSSVVEMLYASKVNQLDAEFGEVVRAVERAGLAGEALIAFTADHGETLYDADAPFKWSHAHTLRRDVLDVPWIVRGPGLPASTRFEGVSRSIDVYPTLAGLAGLNLPAAVELEGIDFSPFLRGGNPPPDLIAYSHTGKVPYDHLSKKPRDFGSVRVALYPRADMALTWVAARRADRVWKLKPRHAGFDTRTFDLAADPGERLPLRLGDDPRDAAMVESLESYKTRLIEADRARRNSPSEARLPDDETEARLRALGYVH